MCIHVCAQQKLTHVLPQMGRTPEISREAIVVAKTVREQHTALMFSNDLLRDSNLPWTYSFAMA